MAGSRPVFKCLGRRKREREGQGLSRRSRLRATRTGGTRRRVHGGAWSRRDSGARAQGRVVPAGIGGARGRVVQAGIGLSGRPAAGGRCTHPPWSSSFSPACRPTCPGRTRPSSSWGAVGETSAAAARRTWAAGDTGGWGRAQRLGEPPGGRPAALSPRGVAGGRGPNASSCPAPAAPAA